MDKLKSLSGILKFKVIGKRTPLSVSWSLTNRCNFRCRYCDVYNNKTKELDTTEIIRIMTELKEAGVQRIGFTGGEPFLRDDIGLILKKCSQLGIFSGVVTNGSLIDGRANFADLIQISMDGSKEINDSQRYDGSYDAAIHALKKFRNKRVWITTVLTDDSINEVDYMISLAEQYDSIVYFQPCLDYDLCGQDSIKMLPDKDKFRKAIHKILNKNSPFVGNSRAGLISLLDYPKKKTATCYSGNLFCHIYSDGKLYSCFNMIDEKGVDLRNKNFASCFAKLRQPQCNGCFSYANIEMNLAFALYPESVMNALRLIK
jgi:MoaA/NifB/PqqE/SkfB family radical SAM enzyme